MLLLLIKGDKVQKAKEEKGISYLICARIGRICN